MLKFFYYFINVLLWLIPISIGIFFFWITEGQPSEKEFFGGMALATVGIPILVVFWFFLQFIQIFISKAYKKEKLRSIQNKAED